MVNGNETFKIMEDEQQALENIKNEVSDAENLRELTDKEVSDTENTEVKKSKRAWTDGLFGVWGKRSNSLATKKIKRRYVVMTPHQYHGKGASINYVSKILPNFDPPP